MDPSSEATEREPTLYETVDDLVGVSMSVKEGSISPAGLTVIFKNNSDKHCIYGEYYSLEKKIEGSWYRVPVAIDGQYGFNDIGYELAPSSISEWAVDWDWLYGSLDSGEYRIVKDVLDFRESGDYDKHYLTAEFTVH